MLIVFLGIIYLAVWVLGSKYIYNRDDLLNTYTIFGATMFIYNVAIPLEISITEKVRFLSSMRWQDPISQDAIVALVFISILGLLSFGLGLKLTGFSAFELKDKRLASYPYSLDFLMFYLTIILFLLFFFFSEDLSLSGTYHGNVEAKSRSIYVYVFSLAILVMSLISAIDILAKRKFTLRALILASVIFYLGVYTSDKNPILLGLAGLGVYFTVLHPPKRQFTLLLSLTACVFALIVGSIAFSLFRSGVYSWSMMLETIEKGFFLNSDPAGPFAVYCDVFLSADEYKLGSSWLEMFYLLIPKFLWPNRPLDIASIYAMENIVNWSPGFGLGYSLAAEAYINFGIFGGVVHYFFIGVVWGLLWKLIKIYSVKLSYKFWVALYHTVGFSVLVTIHRAQLSGSIKQVVIFVIPLVIILTICQRVKWIKTF